MNARNVCAEDTRKSYPMFALLLVPADLCRGVQHPTLWYFIHSSKDGGSSELIHDSIWMKRPPNHGGGVSAAGLFHWNGQQLDSEKSRWKREMKTFEWEEGAAASGKKKIVKRAPCEPLKRSMELPPGRAKKNKKEKKGRGGVLTHPRHTHTGPLYRRPCTHTRTHSMEWPGRRFAHRVPRPFIRSSEYSDEFLRLKTRYWCEQLRGAERRLRGNQEGGVAIRLSRMSRAAGRSGVTFPMAAD